MVSVLGAAQKTHLPMRLTVVGAGKQGFRFLILRNDGTVAEASSATFSTEAAARAAGTPLLRRRSLAAKLTPEASEAEISSVAL
jgi:hypothetical protein